MITAALFQPGIRELAAMATVALALYLAGRLLALVEQLGR